jgi:hypothetical protein
MKTTHNTDTHTIAITEILPDYDNTNNLEICFTANLTRTYLESIFDTDTVNDILDDDDSITFELNVAHRHENGLYYIIQHDRSGDSYSDHDDALRAFGQPVIDFITDACRLLNVPFYPTR